MCIRDRVTYKSAERVNPIHWIETMLESATEWLSDWWMIISMCGILTIIIYQILFRVRHRHAYKGMDVANIRQCSNNAILNFDESSLFSDKNHLETVEDESVNNQTSDNMSEKAFEKELTKI